MEEKKVWLEVPKGKSSWDFFDDMIEEYGIVGTPGENVPVNVAARVMKKDQQFIRQGIILGFLKFGVAFKKEGSSQYDYYISPIKFWQETGYVYDGAKQ